MIQRDGLYWPETDRICYDVIQSEIHLLTIAADLCDVRSLALQAGGNCGLYPLELSEMFDNVVTLEPDPVNWECLEKNLEGTGVVSVRAALGGKVGTCGISHCHYNVGASHVIPGGATRMLTIDSLGLDPDLIQLDLEGYELPAILGGLKTIRRCSPVIMIEVRHGQSPLPALTELGYVTAYAEGHDHILVRTSIPTGG